MTYDTEKLITYVDHIKQLNASSASALVVIKDNEILLEYYSGYHDHKAGSKSISALSQFNVASVRKSYVGLAIAFAIHENKVSSLDDQIITYFPHYDQELYANTTIRHLVTHTHGLNQSPDGTIYREFKAGEGWAYRNINIAILSELIKLLYDVPLSELLRRRVFSPLGFINTDWYTEANEHLVEVVIDDANNAEHMLATTDDGSQSNLHTTAVELAMWGNLHLNEGLIDGVQVVPSEVIRLATTIQSPNTRSDHSPLIGLFWYVQDKPIEKSELGDLVPKGSFQIIGITGPTLLVIPEYNVVVAKMYNKLYNYGGDDGENYNFYFKEFSNLVAQIFVK